MRRDGDSQARGIDIEKGACGRLASLNHFVGPLEHLIGDRDTDLPSRLQIDDQLSLRGDLDGHFCWIGPFEDLVD
jgi:hypothetical protein